MGTVKQLTRDCEGCCFHATGPIADAVRRVEPRAQGEPLCLWGVAVKRLVGEPETHCRLNRQKATGTWLERIQSSQVPGRPPLRYFGSKWRLAPWIAAHFPAHKCYVEPFGGGLSVLLRKPPSTFEFVNDLDDVVVTFFRVLRERPLDLLRAIERTPFARREFEFAREPVADGDELEIARRLYVRAWQGRGGLRTQWKTGWRVWKHDVRDRPPPADFLDTSHLEIVARRLRTVAIDCDDGLNIIRRYDSAETMFYVDPPYLAEVRSVRWRRKAYALEFDRPQDHERLARALQRVRGMVVLSGYPSPLYESLYEARGWQRRTLEANTESGMRTEALWFNPAAVARGIHPQMELFDG